MFNLFKRESDFSRGLRLMQEKEAARLDHARRQLADERAAIEREVNKLTKPTWRHQDTRRSKAK